MKKLKKNSMTKTIGGGYCQELLAIMQGALDNGDTNLALMAGYYYALHCIS